MTRITREQRRLRRERMHGKMGAVRGFLSKFMTAVHAGKEQGVEVMTFPQWRAKKWGGPCHSPASPEERFQYRIYLDQISKVNDGTADAEG